jgi:hypothetical protein
MNKEGNHDLYYLGGLFDGEGYCGVYKAPHSRKQWQLIAGIEMSRLIGLEVMQRMFGGAIHQSYHAGSRIATYRLTYNAVMAMRVLNGLHPYTRVKYDQIALTLETARELYSPMGRPVQELLEKYNEGLEDLKHGEKSATEKGVSQNRPLFVLTDV